MASRRTYNQWYNGKSSNLRNLSFSGQVLLRGRRDRSTHEFHRTAWYQWRIKIIKKKHFTAFTCHHFLKFPENNLLTNKIYLHSFDEFLKFNANNASRRNKSMLLATSILKFTYLFKKYIIEGISSREKTGLILQLIT